MEAQCEQGSSDGAPGKPPCAWHAVQGPRPTMEDEFILGAPLGRNLHLWAVLDGHAGRRAVEALAPALIAALSAVVAREHGLPDDSLQAALAQVDAQLLALAEAEGGWNDGSTATIAVTGCDQDVRLAQVGDSNAALCGAMGSEKLCTDHRLGDAAEDARLEAAGAVVKDGRVVGKQTAIACTRSFGDLDAKRSAPGGVVPTAELSTCALAPTDELLVLACDGLWDVVSEEDAWEAARGKGRRRDGTWDLAAAAGALTAAALAAKTGDNCSVLVLGLRAKRGERQPWFVAPA